MKFGVRECADVVLKAKAKTKIGNQLFDKDEPVIYFDSLKTSTLEGAATTVYATGGPGNSRLISWDGEKTLTFTMEDALMSPMGFAVLSGAGLIKAGDEDAHIHVHRTLQTFAEVTADSIIVDATDALTIGTDKDGNPVYETVCTGLDSSIYGLLLNSTSDVIGRLRRGSFEMKDKPAEGGLSAYAELGEVEDTVEDPTTPTTPKLKELKFTFPNDLELKAGESVLVLVDYYVVKKSGAYQIDITPDKFAGNYYLEASTLFRRQSDGVDLPAELVIPNVRIQSNFTFTMASTGDPCTFTFTLDAFPDYTKWNKNHKVLATMQIIDATAEAEEISGDFTKQILEGSAEFATGTGHKDSGSDIANT